MTGFSSVTNEMHLCGSANWLVGPDDLGYLAESGLAARAVEPEPSYAVVGAAI
jgi:hypothetical protein